MVKMKRLLKRMHLEKGGANFLSVDELDEYLNNYLFKQRERR